MKKHTVFVDGQEGTTGLRIHEYLAARSDIEVLKIDANKRKDSAERARLLNAADVAFLCLPDAAAKEAVALVANPDTCIIDASTAHRVAPGWTFGIPELAPGQRDALRKAKRIANPGCHSTAFIALLRPLVDAGLVARDLPVTATSITEVKLELELENYSGDASEVVSVWDVTTPSTTVEPDGNSLAIYNDLGGGLQYGMATVTSASVSTTVPVPFTLGAQAATDLKAKLGSEFVVGLKLDTVPGFVRFSSNATGEPPRTHRLVVKYLP